MNRMWRALVITGVVVALGAAAAAQKKDANPKAVQLQDFNKRVTQYLEIHKKADGAIASLKKTDDPAEISAREKALADAIRALRPDAQQGEIFTPGVAQQFRTILRNDVRQRGMKAARAMMTEVPMEYRVRVNQTYPTTQPLATVPPLLIAALQPLPEELEYRFLGHALILRDIKANLIVDFIPSAIPVDK